jgi:phosphatidylinositol alpha 1,6-mannosyltransferase
MRIALVTEAFYPAVEGTTRTVKAVADRLVDLGHEVGIVAPGPGLGTYRCSPVVRISGRERLGGRVREALTDLRPDLVHVTSPGPLGRKALKHAGRLGVPTVVVEQSPVTDQAAGHWRAKVAHRADTLLVTAPWMLDRARELGGEPTLWTPGVDTTAFTPGLRDPWLHASWSRAHSSRPTTPLVTVGFVGGLETRHGVRRLAELAAVPGIRPVVVGDGSLRRWLTGRLPGARFTGALETGGLTVALASLDLLVHPGEHETCCHALREAAASGLPVVAPRSGGAPAVVRSLETGVLYDPADARGLQQAVAAVAADPHRALLGARGRELALGRDWAAAVDELVERHHRPMLGRRAGFTAAR